MSTAKILFSLVIVMIAPAGCSSTKTSAKNPSEDFAYTSVATRKLGSVNVQYVFNASKTFVLCMKASKPTAQMPQHRVLFFVYDMTANAIIHEDEIANGDVVWRNNDQVQVTLIPGIIKDDDSSNKPIGYIYDTRLKKKLDISSSDIQKLN